MSVEEEREAWREGVHFQPSLQAPAHVLEAVGQGEGELLTRCGPGFPNVVSTDADGVPLWQVLRPILDGVHHKLHVGLWWEDPLLLGLVLLQDVVLNGPP